MSLALIAVALSLWAIRVVYLPFKVRQMMLFPGLGRSTCLFTKLDESSLVPAGFLTAQFLQKTKFMKPFFVWEIGWCFFYCLPGGKEKY
jgi:hypothetical protein